MYDDIINKYKNNFESDFNKLDNSDNYNNHYLKDSKEVDYEYNNSDNNEYKGPKDYEKYNDFEDYEREMFSEKENKNNIDNNKYNFNRESNLNDFDYEKESKTLEKLNKIAEKKLAKKPSFSNSKPVAAGLKAKSALQAQKNPSKPNLAGNEAKKPSTKGLYKNLYSIENSEILAEIYKNEQEEFEAELRNKHNVIKEDYNNNNNGDNGNEHSLEDEAEREEMENEFEYVKSLNELKEKNKKIEALNKYQSSKIEALQNELEKALNEIKSKDLEIESLKSSGKTPSQENRKTLNQINALNLQLDKYKGMLSDKKTEISGLMEKINEQQKTIDQHAIAERKHKQEVSNKDKQIARLIEEVDRLSSSAANQRNQGNVASAKDLEKLVNENKKLEKQKNEIYAAFKKSLKLCSILKRQKVHLENARLLAFTEEEFKQILEQNNKN